MRAVAYLRVSTNEQAESGLGLDAQRATVLAEAERRAAVAEYRAELAETERDAARDRVRSLRTGTVARLARRVAELTRD